MNNSAYISKAEAAKLAGVTTRTIGRYLKEGKISGTQVRKNPKKSNRVEISVVEIERVFGGLETEHNHDYDKVGQIGIDSLGNVQGQNEYLEHLKKENEALKSDVEKWESRYIESNNVMLSLSRSLLPAPKIENRGLLSRIFGSNKSN